MKNLGLRSDYARLGILFAAIALIATFTFSPQVPSAKTDIMVQYDAAYVPGARSEKAINLHDLQQLAEKFADESMERASVPNFRDAGNDDFYYGSDTPCFVVEFDDEVAGNNEDYRIDMFGGTYIETSDLFRSGLETAMAESFTEEVWARDRKCFNGSFVVSFDVDDNGRIGKNMLVHHITGSSNAAGIAVLDVLRDMDLQGHRWHNGAAGAGEVRIPVKFRLE
ncbi:MAG: hypothetical protein AAF840_02750 [Bacteroidota bacterium]